jgi:hypothetical protein
MGKHPNVEKFSKLPESTCEEFAEILEGTILVSTNDLCQVSRTRDLTVTIMGRLTMSPMVIHAFFSFESADAEGETLNLGVTALLQEEVNPFISVLRKCGITVAALQSPWLFAQPRLMYINFQSIDEPLDFARKVAKAFDAIE